jgi:hypothetical protein
MSKKTPHKFQEKMDLTYEQYFRNVYRQMVYLARELERVQGREKAHEIIRKAREKYAVESTRKEMAERGPIKNFEDFKALAKEGLESPFWSHTLTMTFPEETPKKIVHHITECLWAKTFKEMNATDLGYIMSCHPDFATAQVYHPKIKLKRTKTLMQGDSYCDHTYYWEE